jgi:DNA-binding MarR family transcriptional regulator
MADNNLDPSVDALGHALHLLFAADRRLRARYRTHAEALSHGHLRALYVLMTEQEVTAGRLAKEADLNPASVTAMVDQLEAQGLVQRRRDAQDRRVCLVSLTDEGRAAVGPKHERWTRHLADALGDLSNREIEVGARVLGRLAEAFESFEVEEVEPA